MPKNRNAVHADGWAWATKRPNLAEKLILLCLAKHAGFSAECFPNLETLCDLTGVSRRQAIRAIQALEKDGLISRERRKRQDGSQTSNLYLLNIVGGGGVTMAPQGDTGDVQGVTMAPLINETTLETKNTNGLKKRDVAPTARPSLVEIPQDDRRVSALRRERIKLIPTTRFTFMVDPKALADHAA